MKSLFVVSMHFNRFELIWWSNNRGVLGYNLVVLWRACLCAHKRRYLYLKSNRKKLQEEKKKETKLFCAKFIIECFLYSRFVINFCLLCSVFCLSYVLHTYGSHKGTSSITLSILYFLFLYTHILFSKRKHSQSLQISRKLASKQKPNPLKRRPLRKQFRNNRKER